MSLDKEARVALYKLLVVGLLVGGVIGAFAKWAAQ